MILRCDICAFVSLLGAACSVALPANAAPAVAASEEKDKPAGVVFFSKDSDKVAPEGTALLNRLAEAFPASGMRSLRITAHADTAESGTDSGAALSQRRAGKVRDYLVAHGVRNGEITVEVLGSMIPADEGVTGGKNRRVEIYFSTSGAW